MDQPYRIILVISFSEQAILIMVEPNQRRVLQARCEQDKGARFNGLRLVINLDHWVGHAHPQPQLAQRV